MRIRIFTFLLTLLPFLAFGQGVPELIYYRFDGGGTTVLNQASTPVGNNPATITGQTQGLSGQFGTALIGVGNGTPVNGVNTNWPVALGAGNWTISFWIGNWPSTGTFGYVFGDATAGGFRCFAAGAAGTNNVVLRGPIADVVASGVLASNSVVHYVKDGGVIRAYVNGVLNNTVNNTAAINGAAGPFYVGGYTSGSIPVGGRFDEFRMYNRALTQAEITATWNQPLPLIVAPIDMAVTGFTSPSSASNACFGPNETITLNIANFGQNAIDFSTNNAAITVNVTGPNPQVFNTTLTSGTLASGAFQPVTITTGYNMGAAGTYGFNATISVAGDGNPANNTLPAPQQVTNTALVVPNGGTLTETFDSWPGTGTQATLNGWTAVPGTTSTTLNWESEFARGGQTGSTGPSQDHTNPGIGRYIFLETSGGISGDDAEFESPCIDLSAATCPTLSFWYHMFGSSMGTMFIEAFSGGTWTTLDMIVGQQQSSATAPWLQREINLGAYIGQVIRIRFRGTRGTSIFGDMAIDDFQIADSQPIADIAADRLVSPIVSATACYGIENVTVAVENKGCTVIDFSVDPVRLTTSITGPNPMNYTNDITTGTLAPGASLNVVVDPAYAMNAGGTYDFNSSTSLINGGNDGNPSNDALPTVSVTNTAIVIAGNTFTETFDAWGTRLNATFNGWINTPGTSSTGLQWEAEVNRGGQSSPGTGPLSDHTTPNTPGVGSYIFLETSSGAQGDDAEFESPCIDLTGASCPSLSFWYHMFGADIGTLFTEVNIGGTWTTIDQIVGAQQSGQAADYLEREVNLAPYIGQVIRIRFRGTKGGTSFNGDIAIDDFSIADALPFADLSADALLSPVDAGNCFNQEPIEVRVENKGCLAIDFSVDPFRLTTTVIGPNPQAYTNDLTTGTLGIGQGINILVTPAYNMAAGGTYTFNASTSLINGGTDGNPGNDALATVNIENNVIVVTNTPQLETFDAFTPVNGTFREQNGWSAIPSSANVNLTWQPEFSNFQNNSLTGPINDHTPGNGRYIYLESSFGVAGNEAFFESPCIDLTNTTCPTLSFWYHMYGATMGDMVTEVLSGGVWTEIDRLSGQQHTSQSVNEWQERDLKLGAYIGQVVRVRWRGIRGTSFTGDMAIDDVSFFDTPAADDIGINMLTAPAAGGCYSNAEDITVEVRNFGCTDIDFSNTGVRVTVNTSGANVQTYTTDLTSGILTAGASQLVTVTNMFDMSATGNYTFNAVTTLIGGGSDANPANDPLDPAVTISVAAQASFTITAASPYLETFETFNTPSPPDPASQNGWTVGPISGPSWQVDRDGTSSTNTGPELDHTTGTNQGNYVYLETSTGAGQSDFNSPCFDLTNTNCPSLSFWYHKFGATMDDLITEVFFNGVWTQVSLIPGQTQFSDVDPWLEEVVDLGPYAGEIIRIRFIGVRGTSFTGDMALDDISITDGSLGPDVGISAVSLPLSGSFGCGSTSETIEVTLRNSSCFPVDFSTSNVEITTTVTGPIPQVFTNVINTGTLASNASLTVLVTNAFDVSDGGTYTVTSATSFLTGGPDVEPANDATTETVENPTAIISINNEFYEDWDALPPVQGQAGSFPPGWTRPPSTQGANFWFFDFNNTSSGSTGPSQDADGGGNYIYLETSSAGTGSEHCFVSPCIDLRNAVNPTLEYAYHMYGAQMGTLNAQILDNGTWVTVSTFTGQQQGDELDPWRQASASLAAYKGQITQLRFCGIDGTSFTGDMAVDNIRIFEDCFKDGVTTLCTNADPINLIDLVGGNIQGNGTWSGPLPLSNGSLGTFDPATGTPGTLIFTYSEAAPGDNSGCLDAQITVNLFSDINIAQIDYTEDFENGPNGWSSGGINSDWAFGTPAKSVITGAASGMNAWVTGGLGTATYLNNQNSYVQGPTCFDFSSPCVTQPVVSMDIWYESEFSWDGANLQYSDNGGATWNLIGALNDPTNWYNDGTIVGLAGSGVGSQVGWTGTGANGSGGYINARHDLNQVIGKSGVTFRVYFGSDGIAAFDGFAFDNFNINDDYLNDGELSICANADPVNLRDFLGGNPTGNGVWSGPAALTGGPLGTYDPSTMPPGIYTYSEDINNQCPCLKATVTVTHTPAPNPGVSANVDICSAQTVDLFGALGGTPDGGGVWSGPSALANGDQGTFDGMTNVAGVYTYTVSSAGCNDESATVTVNLLASPAAPIVSSKDVCDGGSTVITPAPAGTYNFYNANPEMGGATLLASGASYDPGTTAGNSTTVWITATDGTCESNPVMVTCTVLPLPTAVASSNSPLFVGQTLTLNGSGGASYSWSGPNGFSSNMQNPMRANIQSADCGVYTLTVTDGNGCSDDVTIAVLAIPTTVSLSPRVILEGPFDRTSGLMRDDLQQQNLVPTTEPYTALGFTHNMPGATVSAAVLGGASAVNPADMIVDWVLVELRDKDDPTIVVASRPALLHRNGDISDLDGVSTVGFGAVHAPAGSYYVAIRHRNHLGVMTDNPVGLSNTGASPDFTDPVTAIYGAANDAVLQDNGTNLLWSGDVLGDGDLRYSGPGNDRAPILGIIGGLDPTAVESGGYHTEDVNMDGIIKYSGPANDRSAILDNIGGVNATAIKTEEIPR